MFRRNNTDSKNNGQPADEKVREEDRAEQDIRQKVGNRAAGNLPPQIPPNIGNEALNDLISGGGNPVQNVIRKGLDISDEINPNEIRLIRDSLKQNDAGSGDEKDLNNINNLNNIDDLNNIDNNNSAFNIVNNNDFPQANGGIFNVLDRIIEEKNKLLQGEEEGKKEIDQPKQVNIINENNMHDDAGFDDEMDLGDYLDPSRIRELRKSPDYRSRLGKPVKPVDLNISNSNIEDALNEDGEDEKEPDQKDGKNVPEPGMVGKGSGKKQPEKKAPVRKSLDREDFRDNYQSASGIYITLILDKLFYGLKEKVLNDPEQGGLSMETVQNYQTLNQWIDGFLVDRVKPKKKEFRMILRGLYRAVKAGEPGKVTSEKMRERLSDIFTKILVNRNFRSVNAPEKELFANMNLSNYTYTLGQNNEYEFSKLLNHMITECLNEDRKKPLDTMVFDD